MKRVRRFGAALLAAWCFACGGNGSGVASDEVLSIAEVIARDAQGVALRLGESVTTEGVATVDAPVFANNKLKLFLQDGSDGVMVLHATSAGVPSFVEGDRLRVTGRLRQADPTSDANRAEGTVMVDITEGSFELVETGEPVPAPVPLSLAQVVPAGERWVGTLVRIAGVRRVSGAWPTAGSRSAEVVVTDDGINTVIVRMQRNTIDVALADRVAAIGDAPFDLTGIVVQDDTDNNGTWFGGHEIWIRGVKDIAVD